MGSARRAGLGADRYGGSTGSACSCGEKLLASNLIPSRRVTEPLHQLGSGAALGGKKINKKKNNIIGTDL